MFMANFHWLFFFGHLDWLEIELKFFFKAFLFVLVGH